MYKKHFLRVIIPFSPADQTIYLCKQCTSWWNGSWWAISSGSTLNVILFWFLTDIPICNIDMSKFKDGNVHFHILRVERDECCIAYLCITLQKKTITCRVLLEFHYIFFKYSITSMARTRMARLPWMIRTLFSVPTKSFQSLKKTNI